MSNIIQFTSHGDFKKSEDFLKQIVDFFKMRKIQTILEEYGQRGTELLAKATPKRSGETADSWRYEVVIEESQVGINWLNDKKGSDGKTPVAILIQMGHGTRNGGYVPANDFINPVMQPLFEELEEAVWKAVTSS